MIQYLLIQGSWWLHRIKLPWVTIIDRVWQKGTTKNHIKIFQNLFELVRLDLGEDLTLKDYRITESSTCHPSFPQFHPFFPPFLTKEFIDWSTEILRIMRGQEVPINEIILKYKTLLVSFIPTSAPPFPGEKVLRV